MFASVMANVIMVWWIYGVFNDDAKPNEELLKSQGRVEILEKEIDELKNKYQVLEDRNGELQIEIQKKPKERIVIQKIYEQKINTVTNMSVDSSIMFISAKLSEINLD